MQPTNNEDVKYWRRAKEILEDYKMKRGMVFGGIIIGALLAFELFNYTTTDFALTDLLGDIRFVGLRWAMILSLAFCGMDFAGIARLFTPEKDKGEQVEVWYLLGAWFLAATMNAMLTWWGVSLALLQHGGSLGNEILSREQLLSGVPVFVAVLVWLIRILMIGTFSMAGERLFTQTEKTVQRSASVRPAPKKVARPTYVIGGDEEEEEDYEPYPQAAEAFRSNPVRRAPAPPARPAAPPLPAVRPVPKPSAGYAPNSGARPTGGRPSETTNRSNSERN
jgi:hypothetical protein